MSVVPEKCPSCGSTLVWSDTGVDLLCQNINCPAQILYKIEYFLRMLGIEELSATTLEKFNLSSIEDVYTKLSFDYIKQLDGFQDKKAKTIMDQINKSLDDVDAAQLLAAFGIPGLGIKNAIKIIGLTNESGKEAFEKLFTLSRSELLSIKGIGNKLIDVIFENVDYIRNTLLMLLKHGLTFKEKSNEKTLLNGMNIALTGAAPNITRSQLEKIIEKNGGNNTGISKKTDILVAEDVNGKSSKLKKARELGITIVTYDYLFQNILGI